MVSKPDLPSNRKEPSNKEYSAHLTPVHVTNTPSLLSRHMRASFAMSSSEARNRRREMEGRNTSRPLDITGFKHLIMLVLVMGNFRMIWSGWSQYGFQDTLRSFGLGYQDLKRAALISATNLLYLPLALAIERVTAAISQSISHKKASTTKAGGDLPAKPSNGSDFSSRDTELSHRRTQRKKPSMFEDLRDNDDSAGEASPDFESDKSTKESKTSTSCVIGRRLRALGTLVAAVHFALCSTCLVGGSILTWVFVDHPLVATGAELAVIVTFLKLASYAVTNSELRAAWLRGQPVPSYYDNGPQYPANLTLNNLVVYWASPTLVYQPVYPRRPNVRWSRLLPLLFEVIVGNMVIWALMMQMAEPVLKHLVAHIHFWDICIEDYLTLAMINIIIWLVGFVTLFHSLLNLAGEITRFSDRKFYSDWWNAGSVGTFWRDWNLPVSNYFRRHIYVPLRAAGVPRAVAANIVFFISAVLHELLFGVGTHNFNGVAFLSMILQPLLIFVTEPLERMRGRGTTVGNCVFWLAIIFGQPTAIVIYFLQWVGRNPASKTVADRLFEW